MVQKRLTTETRRTRRTTEKSENPIFQIPNLKFKTTSAALCFFSAHSAVILFCLLWFKKINHGDTENTENHGEISKSQIPNSKIPNHGGTESTEIHRDICVYQCRKISAHQWKSLSPDFKSQTTSATLCFFPAYSAVILSLKSVFISTIDQCASVEEFEPKFQAATYVIFYVCCCAYCGSKKRKPRRHGEHGEPQKYQKIPNPKFQNS